jgi:glycosyltransferase involved in cell wall biosynthesis
MVAQTDPTISVLLPVRNDEEYISQSLGSLFEQTYSDFEVIVLDAGSTDTTPEILTACDDPRLRVEQVSEDASLYETLNYGLRIARGQFVARQEADGLSAPTRFERQARYLTETPAVVAVGTAVHLLSPGGARTETIQLEQWVTIRILMRQNELVHGTVMIRRAALDAIGGYDPLFTIRGGYDLWLRLLSEGELHNIPEPLYNVRIYREPVSSEAIRKIALSHYFALHQHGYGKRVSPEKLQTESGLEDFRNSLSSQERAAYHVDVAQTLLRYGGRSEARRELVDSLRAARTAKAIALLAVSFGGPLVERFVPAEFQKYRFRELDRKKWE